MRNDELRTAFNSSSITHHSSFYLNRGAHRDRRCATSSRRAAVCARAVRRRRVRASRPRAPRLSWRHARRLAFLPAALRARLAFEAFDLGGREVAPLAYQNSFGGDGADADAAELDDGVPDGVEHVANLLVAPLAEGQL